MKHLLILLLLCWIPLTSADAPTSPVKSEKSKPDKEKEDKSKEKEKFEKQGRFYDDVERERHCPNHSEHEHNFNGKGVGHFVHGNGNGYGHYLCSGNGTGVDYWHRTGGDGFFLSAIWVDGAKLAHEKKQKFVDTFNNIKTNELTFTMSQLRTAMEIPDSKIISVSIHYGDKTIYVNHANQYKPHDGFAFHDNSADKATKDKYRLVRWYMVDEKIEMSSKVLDAAYDDLKKGKK